MQTEKKEDGIKNTKGVDAKKRLASGMARAGQGHLPAKDSLEGV